MRRRRLRAAVLVAIVGVALASMSMPVMADPPIRIGPDYPPGPCLIIHIKVQHLINEKVIVTGCTEPLQVINIFVKSKPQLLGEVTASADGTFRKTFQLPANLEPGTHHVVAKAEGQPDAVQAISLTPQSSTKSGRSPIGLLGLAIIGIGLALVVSTVRWGRRLLPAGGSRVRRATRRGEASSDVPFIDTSGFVPYSSTNRPKGEPESGSDRTS